MAEDIVSNVYVGYGVTLFGLVPWSDVIYPGIFLLFGVIVAYRTQNQIRAFHKKTR